MSKLGNFWLTVELRGFESCFKRLSGNKRSIFKVLYQNRSIVYCTHAIIYLI